MGVSQPPIFDWVQGREVSEETLGKIDEAMRREGWRFERGGVRSLGA